MSEHAIFDKELSYPELQDAGRTLLHVSSTGALSTLDPRDGTPYVSLVEVVPCPDSQGDVLMFLSTLAAHSTNLLKSNLASVLLNDPMAGQAESVLGLPRLTLMGDVEMIEGRPEEYVQAWLSRHPAAQGYMGFTDFHFYRLHVKRARYVGGFGQMGWIEQDVWKQGHVSALAGSIAPVLEHMNDDHSTNLMDYVHARCESRPDRALMVGLDELGFQVEAIWSDEGQTRTDYLRFMFEEPATRTELVRKELVKMAHLAREIIAAMENK